MNEILERYKSINDHAASYTWKRLGKSIDMEKTLEQNGIPDEKDEFDVYLINRFKIIDLIYLNKINTFQQFIYISMMI